MADKVEPVTDQIDSEREIPVEIVREIADKGLFRLLVPRSLGGAELDYIDYLQVIEVLAKADASTGWTINQNNVLACYSAVMPEKTAREIWSGQRAVLTNGPLASSAVALPVDGGYRLSGRWNFSTGIRHATWVAALAPIRETAEGGGPPTDRDTLRVLVMPRDEVTLVDIWQVNGLRGAGSFSFAVNDHFVPEVHSYSLNDTSREPGPLYVIPPPALFGGGFATAALAVARASLDAAIEYAGRTSRLLNVKPLRESPVIQHQIGQAEAVWSSARAFLHEGVSGLWQGACKNHSLTTEERIRLRLSVTHALRQSAEVVAVAYNVCSSSAVFAGNPVQRRFQDIHVITQQGQSRMAHYETVGQFYLGLKPEGLF